MPSSKRRFGFRQGEKRDAEAINALYFEVTGRKRNRVQYAWEWDEAPAGTGKRWVVYSEEDGRIVAHHGLIPIRFNLHGRPLLAGKTENTMVSPDFRKKIVYMAYERKAFDEAKEDFDLLFTTAGGGAPGLIRKRLGYNVVGHWTTYIFYASPEYMINRLPQCFRRIMRYLPSDIFGAAAKAYGTLRLFFVRGSGRLTMIRTEDVDGIMEDLESFWHDHKRFFGLTPERDRHYIQWRIGMNPYHRYRFYLFYEKDHLKGYAIVKDEAVRSNGRTFNKLVIEDMVAAENDSKLYGEFVKHLKGEFRQYDLVGLRIVYGDDEINGRLRRIQFYPWSDPERQSRENAPFYAYHGNVKPDTPWFITEILTEGVK